MTQAFNLAQLANNLNTSGQLDATDGLNGLVANANLASSGTASSTTYLRGDRSWASLPAFGKVLQVVQGLKTNTQTIQTNSWVDVVSVAITPSATSSRIMIVGMINSSQDTASGQPQFRLDRNGTAVGVGDSAGIRNQITSGVPRTAGDGMINASLIYIDSPSTTSALTYKIQANPVTGTSAMYINRTFSDPDQQYAGRAITSIIVMEISA